MIDIFLHPPIKVVAAPRNQALLSSAAAAAVKAPPAAVLRQAPSTPAATALPRLPELPTTTMEHPPFPAAVQLTLLSHQPLQQQLPLPPLRPRPRLASFIYRAYGRPSAVQFWAAGSNSAHSGGLHAAEKRYDCR